MWTAGLDTPGRGMGFRGARLMCLVPWCASADVRDDAPFDSDRQLARDLGWYLAEGDSAEGAEQAVTGAAHFESRLQMAAYRVDAFDVKLADAQCALEP